MLSGLETVMTLLAGGIIYSCGETLPRLCNTLTLTAVSRQLSASLLSPIT